MRYNARMRSKLWLILWLVGILFPIAGLRQSDQFRSIFDAIFSSNRMHVIMHIALFAGLVILLFVAFRWPINRRNALKALLAAFLVGLLQEAFQASVQAFWLNGILYDLGVDLSGGLFGLGLVYVFWRAKIARRAT